MTTTNRIKLLRAHRRARQATHPTAMEQQHPTRSAQLAALQLQLPEPQQQHDQVPEGQQQHEQEGDPYEQQLAEQQPPQQSPLWPFAPDAQLPGGMRQALADTLCAAAREEGELGQLRVVNKATAAYIGTRARQLTVCGAKDARALRSALVQGRYGSLQKLAIWACANGHDAEEEADAVASLLRSWQLCGLTDLTLALSLGFDVPWASLESAHWGPVRRAIASLRRLRALHMGYGRAGAMTWTRTAAVDVTEYILTPRDCSTPVSIYPLSTNGQPPLLLSMALSAWPQLEVSRSIASKELATIDMGMILCSTCVCQCLHPIICPCKAAACSSNKCRVLSFP